MGRGGGERFTIAGCEHITAAAAPGCGGAHAERAWSANAGAWRSPARAGCYGVSTAAPWRVQLLSGAVGRRGGGWYQYRQRRPRAAYRVPPRRHVVDGAQAPSSGCEPPGAALHRRAHRQLAERRGAAAAAAGGGTTSGGTIRCYHTRRALARGRAPQLRRCHRAVPPVPTPLAKRVVADAPRAGRARPRVRQFLFPR